MGLCVLLASQLFVWVRDRLTQDYQKQEERMERIRMKKKNTEIEAT